MAEVSLEGKVVVLTRSHNEHATAYLVGHLGLNDVATHGVAVEGSRGALVSKGMNVLRSAGVAKFQGSYGG